MKKTPPKVTTYLSHVPLIKLLKMKRLEKIDIEQLLAERPFELLTATEQAAVLAEMPEWEYSRLHQLVLRSKATMRQSPKPDPAIRERVLEALRKQPKPTATTPAKTGLLVRMVQYRIPAWQAAAAVVLLLVAHFSQQKQASETLHTETVYVNTTDTIYKEVALPVTDSSNKKPKLRVNVKPRLAKRTMPPDDVAAAYADSSYRRRQDGFTELPDTLPGFQFTVQQPSGRSANEMKDLWQLLGEVY